MLETFTIIAMGFGLGLMHALDADHVMAVSALSNNKPGFKKVLLFCLNWAIGHGSVLLLCGGLLFGLGVQLPESLVYAAELSVGLLLIVLGCYFFWKFKKERIQLTEHSHGDIVHRHWSIAGHTLKGNHTPVMVGVLHGLAGSAPALAIVPALAQGDTSTIFAYLGMFSIGVMLSMLAFGFVFGAVQQHLKNKHLAVFHWYRHLLATASIGVGGYWVVQAL